MSPTLTGARRATAGRVRATRRPASAPPRRVSGPVARGREANPATGLRPDRDSLTLGGRALALVRGLPDHSLIDRLVRGRAWIPVLGALLVGIVAMQVEILKLGTNMGRALERSTSLQTRNESLQARVAGLADDQRIERLAAGMGMVIPTPESLAFLHGRPTGDVSRALANIQTPNPTAFESELAAQAANAAALMPAAPTAGPTTSTTATTADSSPTASGTSGALSTSDTSATSGTSSPTASSPTTTATGSSPSVTPTTTSAPVSGASSTAGGVAVATGAAGLTPTGSSPSTGTGGG